MPVFLARLSPTTHLVDDDMEPRVLPEGLAYRLDRAVRRRIIHHDDFKIAMRLSTWTLSIAAWMVFARLYAGMTTATFGDVDRSSARPGALVAFIVACGRGGESD